MEFTPGTEVYINAIGKTRGEVVSYEANAIGKTRGEVVSYEANVDRYRVRFAGTENVVTVHPDRLTRINNVLFELTIGQYEVLVVLGTYATRTEALQALGEYALGRNQFGLPNRVEYPAINEIVQLQPWS